jgi:ubiquinol-cytochrome c reductase cytochrome b subunit
VLGTAIARQWRRAFSPIVYFLFFLLMPWYTARDKTKPVPERVTG